MEVSGSALWYLAYNTKEFGWFDREHTTGFPTGLRVWAPCSLLSRWVSAPRGRSKCDVAGRRVLELGAGIGLLGLAAALRAKLVVVTDIDPLVLRFADLNARLNDLAHLKTARLAYGSAAAVPFREQWGRFDLILGADVIYSTTAIRPVFESVDELLTEDGVFSLGFIDRDERFAVELEEAARDFGFEHAWPPCFPAEVMGDGAAAKPVSKFGTHGMLAELKRVLERIPKGGACFGEAEEKVQLFEFRRAQPHAGMSLNAMD